MQRGVVCLQGLPVIIQVEQEWSLDRCAAAQNLQALVVHLSPIWPNFWQLVHCVVGETLRYLTTLVVVPAIEISFCLRISCLFSLFSTVTTIEPNLVSGLYLGPLDEAYSGSPFSATAVQASFPSFISFEPRSPTKAAVARAF